jgi:hypothetical protein
VGTVVAGAIAPGSAVAQFVGFMALPMVLGAGYQIWRARIMAVIMRRFGRSALRALWDGLVRRRRPNLESLRPTPADAALLTQTLRSAASSFTQMGVVMGVGAGLIIGLLSPSRIAWSLLVWPAISTLYGRWLTHLARTDQLPPPGGD